VKVWVNGERAEIAGANTVADLALHLGLQPHTVLIEHNGIALHQREWSARQVSEEDRVEVVRVVAGG
jgi:thiamine biosynthesis protein ThiS